MDVDPDDRRYSDEEFEAIVRTAAELERQTARSRRRGLSLGEIRAIAREAGLDPEAVSRAARALGPRRGPWVRLAGGPVSYRYTRVVPAASPSERYARLLGTIRDLTGNQGVAREVAGGLEWKSEGTLDELHVDVSPRQDRTRITVGGDRTATAVLSVTVPLAAWIVALGVTGGLVEPTTAEVAALGVGYLAAALAAARTIWSRTGERLRRRLLILVEELAQEASD